MKNFVSATLECDFIRDKLPEEPLSTLLYRETTTMEEFLGMPARPLLQILLISLDRQFKVKTFMVKSPKEMIACLMGEIMACKSLIHPCRTPLHRQCPPEEAVELQSSLQTLRPS